MSYILYIQGMSPLYLTAAQYASVASDLAATPQPSTIQILTSTETYIVLTNAISALLQVNGS